MPGSWAPHDFPNLSQDNCLVTSPLSNLYNCIAWAAGDNTRWWWPAPLRGISYWPRGVPRVANLDAFVLAFGTLGYAVCEDGSLEEGREKIAIFATRTGSSLAPTHAALQLESGNWTSKLGPLEDVTHETLEALSGPAYGEPAIFMGRPRSPR